MYKSKLKIFVLAIIATLLLSGPAAASWYFDIVETSDNVYNFVLLTDEDLVLYGGTGFPLTMTTLPTLDWTYTFFIPHLPLMELFGSPTEATPGDIDNLTGVAFGGFPTVYEDTVLATFTFTGTGGNLTFALTWTI